MAKIEIISLPYDSGVFEERHGLGPAIILQDGLKERLENDGHIVTVKTLSGIEAFETEIRTTFQLLDQLGEATARAQATGKLPVVLAGNCNSTVGAVSGIGTDDLSLFWLDAHADFNTPETTASGFLDGMGLAMLNGRCWNNMLLGVSGFKALADERIVILGARDVDMAEREALEQTSINCIGGDELLDIRTESAINKMTDLSSRAYIHLDVDVHNPDEAPANSYQPTGGPSVVDVRKVCCSITKAMPLAGITVASYDPEYDPTGITSRVIIETVTCILSKLKA
jgi:arginase